MPPRALIRSLLSNWRLRDSLRRAAAFRLSDRGRKARGGSCGLYERRQRQNRGTRGGGGKFLSPERIPKPSDGCGGKHAVALLQLGAAPQPHFRWTYG